jgi:hypothetical protein
MPIHDTFPRLRRSIIINRCLTVALALLAGFLTGCDDDEDAPLPSENLLESRPFAPTDINLFSPVAYPDATPMTPATGTPPTEAEARQMLEAYLIEGEQNVQEGLALFDNPDLIAKVPNPSLRAGLVGSLGTAGEPAIEFIMNAKTDAGLPKVAIIGFSDTPFDSSNLDVALVIGTAENQMAIPFNPKYKNETPFLFTPTLAHEVLHNDTLNAGYEEITAKAIESSIYLEQLALHPLLAALGTELSRRNNTNALTRLNSGEGPKLGLFQSNANQPVLPGSPLNFTNWFDQFPNTDLNETPGSEVLLQILALMAPGATVPANTNFSMATLEFIDQHQANLSEAELTSAALALGLSTE